MEKISFLTTRIFPDGYWPKEMTPSEREESMNNFERQIYPIWKGIEQKDVEKDKQMTQDEVSKQDILLECLTLHSQDIAIHMSGYKPYRQSQKQQFEKSELDRIKKASWRAAGRHEY